MEETIKELKELISVFNHRKLFTNDSIFTHDASGTLIKDRKGNLNKVNYDNLID